MTVRRVDVHNPPDAGDPGLPSGSDIASVALVVQRQSGTVSAIEYLKSNAVNGEDIQRILGEHTFSAAAASAARARRRLR